MVDALSKKHHVGEIITITTTLVHEISPLLNEDQFYQELKRKNATVIANPTLNG